MLSCKFAVYWWSNFLNSMVTNTTSEQLELFREFLELEISHQIDNFGFALISCNAALDIALQRSCTKAKIQQFEPKIPATMQISGSDIILRVGGNDYENLLAP